jgi:hypothetical protein
LFHDRMDVCHSYPPFFFHAIAYLRIAQRRSVLLRRIRLVRVPNWQLVAGASSSARRVR